MDPLAGISIRWKLALLFAGLCALVFGVGGALVASRAEGALESQIVARLDGSARSLAARLDDGLALLVRRTEDFASDGLIRDLAERLQAPQPEASREALAEELDRHLRANKLPLVEAFADLVVAGREGAVLVSARDDPRATEALAELAGRAPGGATVSGLIEHGAAPGDPALAIIVPLHTVDGARPAGWLLALVRARTWLQSAAGTETGGARLVLSDAAGRTLAGPPGSAPRAGSPRADSPPHGSDEGFAAGRGLLVRSFPLRTAALSAAVSLDLRPELRPVAELRSGFLGIGALLGLVSALLLYFPMRFVVRPLVRLTRAAERLRAGDLDARVPVESDDEIGELSRTFNTMAESMAERTRRLESVAAELRRSETEVRSGRDRLDAIISSMRDGLIVLDAAGRTIMANAAAAPVRVLFEGGGDARSRHVCREARPSEAGPEAAAEPAATACATCLADPGGPPRSCLVEIGERTFEVHTTLLPAGSAGLRGRVLVCRDVTSRILQDEREIHGERLSVLGEVAAVVAHEINNPLASISMFNQILAAELPPDSPLQENTQVIGRNAEAARRTIRELLDYATGASPEIGPLNVHDLLEDVLRFLGPVARRAGAELRLERGALAAETAGDEIRLRQVFVNLVLNAIQAVGSGLRAPASGRLVILSTRDEGERLVVSVADTGPGIPPEARERIFRPFFTTKARGEGTGLGLSTARRIAELHGGNVMLVESGPTGTVFEVRLAARRIAEAVA